MHGGIVLLASLLAAPALAQERDLADVGSGDLHGIGKLAELPEGMRDAFLDKKHFKPMIINGTDTNSYKEVVALGVVYDGYLYGTFCSGTRIANKWILTASHCLDLSDYEDKGFDIYAFVGGDVINGDILDYSEVSVYHQHPDFDDVYLTDDIGLVKVQDNLTTYGNAAVLNDESVRRADYSGTEMLLVGFGLQATNAEYGGEKQYAYLDYDSHDSQFIYTYESESNACNGDSGGPLFELVEEGRGREVAGVVSWGESQCEGTGTAYTRVDPYIDWISGYVSTVQTDWGTEDTEEPPDDTEEPPEDTEEPDPQDTDEPSGDSPADSWDFDTPESPEDGVYGSCSAAPGAAVFWLGLLVLPAVRRRR